MTFESAISEIKKFWTETLFPFPGRAGSERVAALESEFGRKLPQALAEYVTSIVGPATFIFDRVGNPIELYGYDQFSKTVPGYNFNPLTNEPIEGWSDEWFMIGDEGADPIVVDLAARRGVPVLQAMHGSGSWEFSPVAESLPQYVLLAAAFHHAINLLPPDDRVIDDENGFRLNEQSAAWLFPRVEKWAPEFYEEWLGVFDNS